MSAMLVNSVDILDFRSIGVIYLASNPIQHQRTKHVKIDLHFIRDKVTIGEVRVLHVPTAS
jgi:hypothetical protein